MKIFNECGISSTGKVLTYDEFMKSAGWQSLNIAPAKAEAIIAKAEEYLEESIPFISLSMYRDFFVSGKRDAFVKPHIKRREMLAHFTLAEYYEGQGRFISKLVDVLWAILEETTWVIPAHRGHNPTADKGEYPPVYNETDLHGVDLYAANTGAALAFTLLYMRDKLAEMSPILVERTEYELEKRIIRPFLSHHHTWSGEYGGKTNNWVTHVVECVLFVAAVAEKRQHARERLVSRSMAYLDNYTKWMPNDGGCDEGPGYWSGAAASYFIALEELYDMTGGAVDVFTHPLVRAMGEYIYKFNINGDKFINFADCSPNVHPNGYLIARYGERCGSEGMVAFGKMLMDDSPHVHHSHAYRMIKDLPIPKPESAEVTKADRFVWFPDLKVLVARESEDTSRGMFLAIKGGHNKQSHNHNDVGSYIIYKNGMPVVIDPGNTTYVKDTFGPKRYTIWCMQSHYHNLPAFDGIGQLNGQVYASSRECYDEDTHTLSLGLENAYDAAAGVVEYTRCASLDGSVVTVSEDIKLDKEREIDFRLITHKAPEKLEDGKLLLAEGVTLEYDKALCYELEEFDPVGNSSQAKWGSDVLYRMHFTKRAKELKCKFIFK